MVRQYRRKNTRRKIKKRKNNKTKRYQYGCYHGGKMYIKKSSSNKNKTPDYEISSSNILDIVTTNNPELPFIPATSIIINNNGYNSNRSRRQRSSRNRTQLSREQRRRQVTNTQRQRR